MCLVQTFSHQNALPPQHTLAQSHTHARTHTNDLLALLAHERCAGGAGNLDSCVALVRLGDLKADSLALIQEAEALTDDVLLVHKHCNDANTQAVVIVRAMGRRATGYYTSIISNASGSGSIALTIFAIVSWRDEAITLFTWPQPEHNVTAQSQ